MRLNFVKVNPAGNTTVYILNSLPREMYPKVAREVMKTTNLAAEQVGFLESATAINAVARLHMMGGEFCGNAARGFAAWLAFQGYPGICTQVKDNNLVVPIEVSGHQEVLEAIVSNLDSEFRKHVKISMPKPKWIKEFQGTESNPSFSVVSFEGIVHAILWNQSPSEQQFQIIKERLQLEIEDLDCFGVLFYDEKKNYLTPIVYVGKANSLVWESSCGSGSVAVGVALAHKLKRSINSLVLSQPGGELEVSVNWENNVIVNTYLSGDIIIKAEGTTYIEI